MGIPVGQNALYLLEQFLIILTSISFFQVIRTLVDIYMPQRRSVIILFSVIFVITTVLFLLIANLIHKPWKDLSRRRQTKGTLANYYSTDTHALLNRHSCFVRRFCAIVFVFVPISFFRFRFISFRIGLGFAAFCVVTMFLSTLSALLYQSRRTIFAYKFIALWAHKCNGTTIAMHLFAVLAYRMPILFLT